METPLATQLLAKNFNSDIAAACGLLFKSFEEAKPYIGQPDKPVPPIKEFFSLKYSRYYYHLEGEDTTSWEFPPPLQLSEWMLDAAITGQDVRTCRRLLSAVLWAVQHNAWKGEAVWTAVGVLAKLTGNIVDCGNTVDKYRAVRKSNPKIKEALTVLDGGEAVLQAAGFSPARGEGDVLVFPSAEVDLRPITCITAKLRQLVEKKGFTGMARECDDTASTSRSRHAAEPGFRYQAEIFECSCCSRPINDGSDRLVTRKFDAPRGEFRYECDACAGTGAAYNLCETCWDKFLGGALSPPHPATHPFTTHHPKTSQHNLQSHESDANPWGVVLAGGSAARARERLKNRTGL